MRLLFGIAFAIAATACTVAAARIPLHLLQQESYQLPGYLRALRRNPARAGGMGALLALLCLMALGFAASRVNRAFAASGSFALSTAEVAWVAGGCLLCLAGAALAEVFQRKQPAKKPLVYTQRMQRLYAVLAALSLVLALALGLSRFVSALTLVLPAFAAALVYIAALCAQPMEKRVNMGFYRAAQRKLQARPDLIKVGITGSYGKTSTKYMLEAILSQKYRVLMTPGNLNTDMGVTRVINEQLLPEHQVFIAEMGARHPGDIKTLMELVKPKYGIVTSVGPQHLETFGSVDGVANTKFELVQGLPEDGAVALPSDDGIAEGFAKREAALPLASRHIAGNHKAGRGMAAKDVEVGAWGSRFTLQNADGKTVKAETKLLGAHNISNLLLAATLADVMGMTLEEIASGIAKVEPVEHRLQILPGQGVTVIDDAYNANPKGAEAAIDVLTAFSGRHIVVTPGMVELGGEEDALNRGWGVSMAKKLGRGDIAVLVGHKHAQPIADGLTEGGFPQENLRRAANLAEAQGMLPDILRPGDTVLFENDLPDSYNE